MENKLKTWTITMTQSFTIEAGSAEDAESEAIELCADSSEYLMPHNMVITCE